MEYVYGILLVAAGVVVGNGVLMLLLVSGPVAKWMYKKVVNEINKSIENMDMEQ